MKKLYVVSAFKNWQNLANKLNIAKREMQLFEPIFEQRIKTLYT